MAGGGFHGGGWHGGGWHGGGWHRGGWGGGVGPDRLSSADWLLARCLRRPMRMAAYGYGGYGGCTSYAPIYDAYGNYIGQQPVYGC